MNARTAAGTASTWLFVPGDRPERFPKAAAAGADLVVLDLEDAVAPARKQDARRNVVDWLADHDAPCAVRINAAGTPWYADDVAALAGARPVVVMAPKSEDVLTTNDLVRALPEGSAVAALVETALGVRRGHDLAAVEGVLRLVLGTYDLAAQLGVDPDHAPAIAPARGALVLASAAVGLAGPVDGVTGDVHDADQLTADVSAAAAVGFAGKLCIHPAQVAPAAAALAPPEDEVAWAQRVLAATDDEGVVVVDGQMVDAPVVARARRIAAAENHP
ncbi:CoA ester lyase [Saccharopolyspora rhizosphaerae]|uniref:CoA ester lyase n=1 Tax=Saccharopolyspora rhizosphaerae TaxID=2492662 RepID=A0A3R8QAY3_9PSEU|nr:CoA ester lyase [Saccharopolyspora rhizosphaerae]RRO16926.1 CoA ester lyase [Saccharopolyspora rhizosphaerae]